MQRRAAAVGFDWPDLAGPLAQARGGARGAEGRARRSRRAGARERARPAVADELGDLLFAARERGAQARTSTPSSRSGDDAALRGARRARAGARGRGRRGLAELDLDGQDALLRRAGRRRTLADEQASIARFTAARCSTRGGTRRSRSTSGSSRARSGAPPCRRAPRPASTRRSSCATAATPGAARASTRAVANVNGEIATLLAGFDADDQAGVDARADRARRHAEQGPPRRERDPRRLARGREGLRRRARCRRSTVHLGGDEARTLPVPMMNVINGGAARGQLDRPAGVHARPGRRVARSPRRCGSASEVYHALRGGAARARARDRRSATRAASRPTCRRARRRSRRSSRRPSAPAAASSVAIALDPATTEVYRDGVVPLRGPRALLGRAAGLLGRPRRALPDRLDRGRRRRGRLGRRGRD